MRKQFQEQMRDRLDELKSDLENLQRKRARAEINLELELVTLIEELQESLEATERKLELMRQANDDDWQAFRTELESVWSSAREMIRAVTAP